MNFLKTMVIILCLIAPTLATPLRKANHSHLKRAPRGWFSHRNRGLNQRQYNKIQRMIRDQSYRRIVVDESNELKIEKFSHYHRRH